MPDATGDGHTGPVEPTLRALRSVVGPDHVVTDPDRLGAHTVDWTGRYSGTTPAVVLPGSTAEVAGVVECCRRDRVALVPQGGNTGLVGGSVPLAGEVVLSTRRLDEVTDGDPDAGQLTAGAGVTIAAVQDAAAGLGWRYGVDFAARGTATVGGSIATNAGGLRVIRHGATRRQVLGVEVVLGTGATVSDLSGLVKDNTGYDLSGLLCGSEGTLGVVTRARLALVPTAGPTVTALVGCRDVQAAVALAGRLRRGVPAVEAIELVLADGAALVAGETGATPPLRPIPPVQLVVEAVGPPDPEADLARNLDGAAGVTDVAVATDAARARALWHVREAHTEAIARVGVARKYDVTLPLRALADFADQIPSVVAGVDPGARTWVFGHVADGNLHVNVTGAAPAGAHADPIGDAVFERVVAAGGSVSAEHGIGTAKRAWLAPSRSEAAVDAMRAIKAALDPDGICNPDVLFT